MNGSNAWCAALPFPPLPPRLKHVIELFVVEGRSVRDISHRLMIPEATVRTRLFQARLALREHQYRPP